MSAPRPPRDDDDQRGSALVMAAIVMMLLTTMGITLLFIANSDAKMNQAGIRAKRAYYIAEAGLEGGSRLPLRQRRRRAVRGRI